MASWDDVAAIGARLEGVEEGTWYGTPALKAGGKGFCRMRSDPDALVMLVADEEDKEALLAGDPDVYFTIPHYDGHPFVLVRLDAIGRDELAGLIEDGRRARASTGR